MASGVRVGSDLSLYQSLYVGSSMSTNYRACIESDLSVTRSSIIGRSMSVGAPMILSDNLSVSGRTVAVQSQLSVGIASVDIGASVIGPLNVGGILSVQDSIDALRSVSISGPVVATSGISITGPEVLGGSISVEGAGSLDTSISISGSAWLDSCLSVGDKLISESSMYQYSCSTSVTQLDQP